jgi:hypothetical protein
MNNPPVRTWIELQDTRAYCHICGAKSPEGPRGHHAWARRHAGGEDTQGHIVTVQTRRSRIYTNNRSLFDPSALLARQPE